MRYQDQRCLGLFLLELRRHRESLLRRPAERQSQRQITDFFRPPTTGQTEGHTTQESPGIAHTRGTLIDRAIELGKSRRPRHGGYLTTSTETTTEDTDHFSSTCETPSTSTYHRGHRRYSTATDAAHPRTAPDAGHPRALMFIH